MGCDIHVHTEIKIDGKWEHLGHPSISRWYTLFAKMAGVRNDLKESKNYIEPISPPRGLPLDCSFITKYDYHRCIKDWHSVSWLRAGEIDELEDFILKFKKERGLSDYWYIEKDFGYIFGSGWNIDKYPIENIEDARWVFWFDN